MLFPRPPSSFSSPLQMDGVYELYRMDFELFGYRRRYQNRTAVTNKEQQEG